MTLRSLLLASALVAGSALAASPSDPSVSASAVVEAASIATTAAPQAARAVLAARPAATRGRSVRWIGAPTDDPRVAAVWLDLALHGQETETERAGRAAIGASLAEPELVAAAWRAAESPRVRGAIAGALVHADPEVVPAVLAPALRDADPDVRHVAISTLGRRADAAAYLPLIRQSLADGAAPVRATAAFGLGVHGTPADAALVARALTDRDGAVRLKALRALERLDRDLAIQRAAALHDDPDPAVARAARALR